MRDCHKQQSHGTELYRTVQRHLAGEGELSQPKVVHKLIIRVVCNRLVMADIVGQVEVCPYPLFS